MKHKFSHWLLLGKLLITFTLLISSISGDGISISIILLFCLPLFITLIQLYLFNQWYLNSLHARIISLNIIDLLSALLATGLSFSTFAAIAVVSTLTLKEADAFILLPLAMVSSSIYLVFSAIIIISSITLYIRSR
ncbi:MAG: hypothetical protein Q9M20_04320 [Mariprofundaceae bacterium]|nr:hypothetical protein [Mariprofundaceae bacterium]